MEIVAEPNLNNRYIHLNLTRVFSLFWGGTCRGIWVICDSACKSSIYKDTAAGSTQVSIPLLITAQLPWMFDSHGASTDTWGQHNHVRKWDLISILETMVCFTGCILKNCVFPFSIKKHILHSIYILYNVTINKDYLSDYLSIIDTVNHNSNVGMGNNSQCIHFTISTRIHSLVIHRFTVAIKRWDSCYILYTHNIFITLFEMHW